MSTKALLIRILVAPELTRACTEKILKMSIVLKMIRRYRKALQVLKALMAGHKGNILLLLLHFFTSNIVNLLSNS